MANGYPLNNLEHDNLTPREYSLPIERRLASAYGSQVIDAVGKQTYLPSEYTGVRFDDYAGIVFITPPVPTILPNIPLYNGIAPLGLQPQIDPPYPYEVEPV